MPLLYNILYKPKEKMTQTVKFSTRRCVPFRCVWGGSCLCGAGGLFDPHTHAGCDIQSNSARCICKLFDPHTHAGCDSKTRQNVTFHGRQSPLTA